ncbi:guanine nucleotide-binding protein subunit alpha [Anaeramoeba flamelloides]|uniref:Guanine nucleotide-binding protein subunit alpha n=1 Tax=Anaeramoeba flamelloides TaxID=1746091 RepID=A0ABQ8XHM2_9EUKA|nr:guanine nucleotide-binding protein subunit alpha [Anaeramoeba flamelloides]
MGNCCDSNPNEDQEERTNKGINRELREHQLYYENTIKLLLLGSGESGKSTISKQMKIIHLKGFNLKERQKYRETLRANTLLCLKALIKSIDKLDLKLDTENQGIVNELLNLSLKDFVDHKKDIRKMWNDSGIQVAYSRRSEFQLYDSAA